MSDGGEDVRQVQEYLHPNSEHLIDWFHITMRLTVLQQQTKALNFSAVSWFCPGSLSETTRFLFGRLMHANNEVGTIQPIEEISRIAREHDIPLHTDAAQSVGKIRTKVRELGVDLLSVAGHKLYGPKGVGALYVRNGIQLEPLIHGAGHEGGRRAGTENVLLNVGLGAACEVAESWTGNRSIEKLGTCFGADGPGVQGWRSLEWTPDATPAKHLKCQLSWQDWGRHFARAARCCCLNRVGLPFRLIHSFRQPGEATSFACNRMTMPIR